MASGPQGTILLGAAGHSPLGRVVLAGRHEGLTNLQPMPPRVNPTYALVLVLAGRGRFLNQAGRWIPVASGSLMLIFPGLPYCYRPDRREPWSEMFLHFEGPAFDLWRDRGLLTPQTPVRLLTPPAYWASRLEAVITGQPAAVGESSRSLARVCLLQQFLADAVAHRAPSDPTAADRRWLDEAQRAVMADTRLRPDWRRIAARMAMSYERWRKRFTALAGMPPAQHRMALLINRATTMLVNPDRSLKDIAADCGFCDEFHFSKQFKRWTGRSPGQMRQLLASGQIRPPPDVTPTPRS